MKIRIIGDSYALVSGNGDPAESGFLSLRLCGEGTVGSLSVNGRAFPVSESVCRVPVTAFVTGAIRISLRRVDGWTIPSEGIRLTGGIFSPAGAEIGDVVAACDKRLSALAASLAALSARVKALEEESGILP